MTFHDALRKAEGDDQPRTLYVKRPVKNGEDIVAWAKLSGFDKTLPPEDMHVTLAFSRAMIPWPEPKGGTITLPGGTAGFGRSVEPLGDKGAMVLRFDSDLLAQRWQELRDLGASWDWPGFKPHISISYNAADVDTDMVIPYTGPIILGPEVFAEVDEDWTSRITEKNMAVTEADIIAYLKTKDGAKLAAAVQKDMVAADAHVSTALGNNGKRKNFADFLAEAKKAPEPEAAEVDKGEPEGQTWELPLDIIKAEPDQRLIFGWASISTMDGQLVIDKQGDMIHTIDLEQAAYDFVLFSRQQGDMHMRKGVGRLIESIVFTKEKQAALHIDLGLEGWWVGFKVDDDDLWDAHKRGDRPEFSIGGRGVRVPA